MNPPHFICSVQCDDRRTLFSLCSVQTRLSSSLIVESEGCPQFHDILVVKRCLLWQVLITDIVFIVKTVFKTLVLLFADNKMKYCLRQPILMVLLVGSCLIFTTAVLAQANDIILQDISTLQSSILDDIQALNASCLPKDTCRVDKVSDTHTLISQNFPPQNKCNALLNFNFKQRR